MGLGVIDLPAFSLEGTVEEVFYKKGLPKVVILKTALGTVWIKLEKSLRRELVQLPKAGDRLRLAGTISDKYDGWVKQYKASYLEFLATAQASTAKSSQLCRVLMCQKSSCCHRGAKELWQELEAQRLPITLKATGCMGECKRGPAVVVLPHKKRLTHATVQQIRELVLATEAQGVEDNGN
ncbi:MAG: (2Fe-2S) ferredoxin domain-containing protein [Thermosynechococcus sp. Uc]|uniref:(2Fe-2S) ferredoxin domain-containing protein n=1 Tax=Thermosynechococcus sp. Uc TaxID=3034853 RepID=UPI00259DB570|nr:(2Fe-2S) ferredoxin domain-containing protein [Thermosynechococcus sp. Uc]MDM7326391.1 (2Fe-2S) ferredoxin domain-containing protein [Thermosynechococcus sp. Uc]